jgi:hypothetical protein
MKWEKKSIHTHTPKLHSPHATFLTFMWLRSFGVFRVWPGLVSPAWPWHPILGVQFFCMKNEGKKNPSTTADSRILEFYNEQKFTVGYLDVGCTTAVLIPSICTTSSYSISSLISPTIFLSGTWCAFILKGLSFTVHHSSLGDETLIYYVLWFGLKLLVYLDLTYKCMRP